MVVLSLNVLDVLSRQLSIHSDMKSGTHTRGWKSVAAAALLVVFSFCAAFVTHPAVVSAWNQAAVRQSQPYTVLAFINTGNLPTYTPPGKVSQITFRISNYETAATVYQYRAYLGYGSTEQLLDHGTLTVDGSGSVDKTISFTLPQPDMTATITIRLVDHPNYITFGTAS